MHMQMCQPVWTLLRAQAEPHLLYHPYVLIHDTKPYRNFWLHVLLNATNRAFIVYRLIDWEASKLVVILSLVY
jgi:hypothetical protein